jgi:hypothetical protein
MNIPERLRCWANIAPATGEPLPAASCGLAWAGGDGQAYSQEAFHYFLQVERKRSERSGRPFLLLIAGLRRTPGSGGKAAAALESALAADVFSALSLSVRETDFIGWYREPRLAGAVLTQRPEGPHANVSGRARERIVRSMAERLPGSTADRLHVRACQLPLRVTARSLSSHS